MAVKEILQIKATGGSDKDNQILHSKSMQIDKITDQIRKIIQDLRDTLWNYPFCVGLSAPQIGINQSISLINFNHEDRNEDLILINPHILSTSGKKDKKRESCMSVWGKMGEVERRSKVEIEYVDTNFQYHREQYEGFKARIIQHELDHLNGIVYVDHMVAGNELLDADFFDKK